MTPRPKRHLDPSSRSAAHTLVANRHTDTDTECIYLRTVGPRGPVGDDTVAGAWQSAIVDLVRP